jgi:transposase-like protein
MESKNNGKSGRKTPVSGRELDSMLKDYVEGKKSVSEIAKQYGITPGALTSHAKKVGLPLRGRGRWQREKPTAQQKKIFAFAAK